MNDAELHAILKEMGTEAAKAAEPRLPNGGQIWFRAQIQRNLRRRERIERPLLVMRSIAVAICLAVTLAFAGEIRPAISSSYALPLLVLTAISVIASWFITRGKTQPASGSREERK